MLPGLTTRYVTLAYGNAPGVYRQSLMLLVSLVAHAPEPYELVVATDRPECYVWFGTRVDIEYIDRAVLEGWKGQLRFSMREKLALLRAAWPDHGAIVLVDADVVAHRDLSEFVTALKHGDIFMHKREYLLAHSRRAGNRRLWKQLQRLARGGELSRDSRLRIDGGAAMWNSGVIALPSSDRALAHQALRLYDELADAGVRHFATEQLVEGIVYSATGRLREAQPWFTHYWGNKPGFDHEIASRLADAFIEGMSVKEAAERFREHPLDLPVEVRPGRREKLRRWLRKS
jgi:hypothetical protein